MIHAITTPRRALAAVWGALGLAIIAACTPTMERTGTPIPEDRAHFVLAIHGGAGTISRDGMTQEQEAEYRVTLTEALHAGQAVLAHGGSSLDAVEAAIRIMEDSPLFNAGRGAVFTAEGTNEFDASIMDGRTLDAGAVAAVSGVKNPISLARLVMEESPHVMLAQEGAESFGREHGTEMVSDEYFFTERRWESLERAREAARRESRAPVTDETLSLGTVGAVAMDANGNLAAATSTGGMTHKRFGRIGDSPVIGAGTYADNRSCAVSGTGHGEYFIRNVVAYDICARVMYTGAPLEDAANAVIMERLVEQGATGGVIAIDNQGNIAMPFNTPGMYRGHIGPDGRAVVMIWDR